MLEEFQTTYEDNKLSGLSQNILSLVNQSHRGNNLVVGFQRTKETGKRENRPEGSTSYEDKVTCNGPSFSTRQEEFPVAKAYSREF